MEMIGINEEVLRGVYDDDVLRACLGQSMSDTYNSGERIA